jgi:hypothetical protein
VERVYTGDEDAAVSWKLRWVWCSDGQHLNVVFNPEEDRVMVKCFAVPAAYPTGSAVALRALDTLAPRRGRAQWPAAS